MQMTMNNKRRMAGINPVFFLCNKLALKQKKMLSEFQIKQQRQID